MTDVTLAAAGTVLGVALIVTILMTVLKRALWPKPEDSAAQDRWAPLLAVALGIVTSVLIALFNGVATSQQWGQAVLTGLLGGASAVGLYTTTKNAINQ